MDDCKHIRSGGESCAAGCDRGRNDGKVGGAGDKMVVAGSEWNGANEEMLELEGKDVNLVGKGLKVSKGACLERIRASQFLKAWLWWEKVDLGRQKRVGMLGKGLDLRKKGPTCGERGEASEENVIW